MKIQVMSDLHLEFKPKHYPLISEEADVIVLAGDVSTKEEDFESFLINYVRDFTDAPVVMVLGNHDYYGKFLKDAAKSFKDASHSVDDVHVLDNECVIIDGVKFVGTTLWTDFDNRKCEVQAMMSMPDYAEIKKLGHHYNVTTITSQDIYDIHKNSVKFVEDELESGLKTVVISHHIPTWRFIHEKYRSSFLNGAFCTDLDSLMFKKSPIAWICGHTHDMIDGKVGETRVCCNPYGYPFEGQKAYQEEWLIEV